MNLQTLLANRPAGLRTQVLPKALSAWSTGIKAESAADENSISIMDVIGEDWYGGVSSARVDAALRYIGRDKPVTVYINSPGGDVFEGLAIYSLLMDHAGKVTIKNMGLAASAASIIMMAGKKPGNQVITAKTSFTMIHNCWTCACGDQNDFRKYADYLAQFDEVMAELYHDRTGNGIEQVAQWMDDETWMNGKKSVELKFADSLMDEPVKTDEATAAAFSLRSLQAMLAQNGMTGEQAQALLNPILNNGQRQQAPAFQTTGEAAALSQSLQGIFS